MNETKEVVLDFAKIAFGAFITILNGWILWVLTEIKNDIRELRAAVYRETTPAPQRRQSEAEKESV